MQLALRNRERIRHGSAVKPDLEKEFVSVMSGLYGGGAVLVHFRVAALHREVLNWQFRQKKVFVGNDLKAGGQIKS